jgi:hypothetical protein
MNYDAAIALLDPDITRSRIAVQKKWPGEKLEHAVLEWIDEDDITGKITVTSRTLAFAPARIWDLIGYVIRG